MFGLIPHKQAIDQILIKFNESNEFEVIRLFIDLRNAIVIFHDEHSLQNSIMDPELMISDIISDILNFMNYIYELIPYETEFHFFWEVGRSEYHKKINKKYKSKRGSSYVLLKDEEIRTAKNINIIAFQAWEIISQLIYNTRSYRLNYFEADFIPQYIIRDLTPQEKKRKYLNVILSNDKDMYQSVDGISTFQLKKTFNKQKERITIVIDDITKYEDLLKIQVKDELFGKELIPDILAIAGDTSDEIEGIPRFGYVRAFRTLSALKLTVRELYEQYESYNEWYDELYESLPEPEGRKRKKTIPYSQGILNNIKTLFEYKDKVLENLKLIDFNIIKEHLPHKQYMEILDEFNRETKTHYKKLEEELKALKIDINDLRFISQNETKKYKSEESFLAETEKSKFSIISGVGSTDNPNNSITILQNLNQFS